MKLKSIQIYLHILELDILIVTPCHSPLETKLDLDTKSPNEIDATSEIISVKKRRKIWSAKTRYASKYPLTGKSWRFGVPRELERVTGGFGGELDGALIVGNYQCVYQYDVKKDKWIDVDAHSYAKQPRESSKGCKIGSCYLVYGERAEILEFNPFLKKPFYSFSNDSNDDDSNNEETVQVVHDPWRDNEQPSVIANDGLQNFRETLNQMCISRESECTKSSGSLKPKDNRPFWQKIGDRITIFASPSPTDDTEKQNKECKRFLRVVQRFCDKPSGTNGRPLMLRNPSLINIDYDKVILSGDMGQMFMGQLMDGNFQIRWKRLERMPSSTRSRYLIFKMKEYVYVIGGYEYHPKKPLHSKVRASLSCEKYNLTQKQWWSCRHKLPFPLNNASVAVAPDESYAVITGGLTEKGKKFWPTNWIMIFEEETGFTLLEDKMFRRRADHVSIVMK